MPAVAGVTGVPGGAEAPGAVPAVQATAGDNDFASSYEGEEMPPARQQGLEQRIEQMIQQQQQWIATAMETMEGTVRRRREAMEKNTAENDKKIESLANAALTATRRTDAQVSQALGESSSENAHTRVELGDHRLHRRVRLGQRLASQTGKLIKKGVGHCAHAIQAAERQH